MKPDVYETLRPESKAVHRGGYRPEWSVGAAVMPSFNSSSYVGKNARGLEKKFFVIRSGGEELVYSRLGAPNPETLEKGYAGMFYSNMLSEPQCVLACSGMEAIALTFDAHLRPGDVVLHNTPLYGGTYVHLRFLRDRYGIVLKSFTDAAELEILLAHACTRMHAKMIFIESPTNPTLAEVDIAACATLARYVSADQRSHRGETWEILVAVDNTFMTPYLQRPLALGAHLEIHSATKYLGGHGDLVAGIVMGERKHIAPIRGMRGQRGGVIDAERVKLLERSLETLGMRMDVHCKNAARVAEYLITNGKVHNVRFLGLLPEDSPQYAIHQKQCCGASGMISFEVRGGIRATRKFLDSLRMIMLAVSLGASHSLACHPARTTHSGIAPQERKKMGIPDNLVRLSVGLEHYEDIIADLTQALQRI